MKNLLLMAAAGLFTFGANAQVDPLREAACKDLKSTVDKNIKSTENPKQSAKSSTWVKLAESYIDLGKQCSNDSMAAKKGYETYKKALEIENAAGGKKSKDITEAMNSTGVSQALLQQGAAFYTNHNLPSAGECFQLSSDINPKDTTAALYAGIVYQSLKKAPQAAASFERFVANGGKDPVVYYSLAQVYKNEKKYDAAVAILKKGSAANPNNKDLKAEIINSYLAANNIDAAITDLEHMVAADPSNTSNLANLGLLYDNKSQESNGKIADLKSQLQKSNTDALKAKMDNENLTASDIDNEIKKITANLKKDPKNAVANKKRIAELTSQKNERLEKAESLKKEIAEKEANKGQMGDINAKIDELTAKQREAKNKAFEAYNKVLAVDPNNYDVNYNIAVMYFNDAVETKKVIDNMDMKTYQKDGKAVEAKACAEFQKAKPYFDKCQSINSKDDAVIDNLKNLNKILETCK